MSYRQFRFRLPWQSLKASSRPENESPRSSSKPTDEAETADTVPPYIRHLPVQSRGIEQEQSPLESAQAPERSETMPPSKSNTKAKAHSQPSSYSRAKNETRKATKRLSASKVIPQSSVASNKSSSASAKASPSHDTSKPSSSAGKVSPSHDASKPSSSAGKVSPSLDTLKPSSPAGKAFPSRDASKPSSSAAAAPRSQISSKPPSPSQTFSKNHLHSKPTSQSRSKADSQPSSPSRPAFSPQASSIPRSPSHESSRQQPSKKASRVQSPSHLSSKPTAESTSQQLTESPAAIGDQTTNRIVSHPVNESRARPKSRENQVQTKSKESPKPDLKPVESEASKDQPETKEEFTSKNTSDPHSNQDSSEIPIVIDQTIENGPEPSLESQTESKEDEEIKSYKEDLAKTTNALQTNASKSKLITSAEIPSPFEPENRDSQQEGTMEDLSKAFQTLNIKYPDEENPKSFTTLTGDNKGASMQLFSGEAKKESSMHIHRQYKSDPDQGPKNSTDVEENSNQETPQDSRTEEDPPLELYININVQGINNSILSNSSFTENNPGIKLKFDPEPTKSEDKSHSLHARKAKHTAKHTEKHTYEPTVRRRCLEGLLMESSDSEVDNSEKPRRHGCRYRGSFKEK